MLKRLVANCRLHRGYSLLLTAGTLMMLVSVSVAPLAAQTHDENASEKKPIIRVEPDYPETLKRLYIGGVVRVEVLVAQNGVVESTSLLGGNPILGQAAIKAVKQWKYAPAKSKETLTVKLDFDPHR
ncbi:MAG: energy transducer TonB [Terriglobales bacterium]|jgi:TonB family protein